MKAIEITCRGATTAEISDLEPFQGNLKDLSKENFEKLKKEIIELGFSEPISVWENKGKKFILNGHQRVRTLIQMKNDGYKVPKIPINLVDAEDYKKAKKKVLALTSQYGEMTDQGLYEFLEECELDPKEIKEEMRFPEIDFEQFMENFYEEPKHGKADEDEIPEQPDPVCKKGDLWQLGEHRLLCGDATKTEDVERLMDGGKASVWASDPPYGIDHVAVANEKGQAKGYKSIENDEKQDEELREFIYSAIIASLPHLKEGFAFYMWHAMKMQAYFSQAAAAAGILFHRQIIWVKPNFVFGRGQYHWRHELCLMGWLKGNEPPFYGEKNQSTVWEIDRENDKIHPTQKPVAIWMPAILNHTKANEMIYDPFGGSGSTLIACEKTARKCYMMEIDPHYCDIIIKRWEDYTGNQAQKL